MLKTWQDCCRETLRQPHRDSESRRDFRRQQTSGDRTKMILGGIISVYVARHMRTRARKTALMKLAWRAKVCERVSTSTLHGFTDKRHSRVRYNENLIPSRAAFASRVVRGKIIIRVRNPYYWFRERERMDDYPSSNSRSSSTLPADFVSD